MLNYPQDITGSFKEENFISTSTFLLISLLQIAFTNTFSGCNK